ncbi:MAG: hypothetical protein IJN90_04185 [Bacilli bacterium]|nr:hypothetical protein [Bacilli bacterium]
MDDLTTLILENKEIVLLSSGLILLAIILYLLIIAIDKKNNTIKIKVIPKININIELHEDGAELISYSYIEDILKLNKIPKKISVDAFFEYMPKDIVIEYDYQITFISNNNNQSKRVGITTDIEEIKDQILNLKKYH